jgi:hypothetical protein
MKLIHRRNAGNESDERKVAGACAVAVLQDCLTGLSYITSRTRIAVQEHAMLHGVRVALFQAKHSHTIKRCFPLLSPPQMKMLFNFLKRWRKGAWI